MTKIDVFRVVWDTERENFMSQIITDGIDLFNDQELWFHFLEGLNDFAITTLINDTRDATIKYEKQLKKKNNKSSIKN